MKAFRFSLEAVATMRRHAEQGALEQYARALLAHRKAVERLAGTQAELDAAMEARRAAGSRTAAEYARGQAWQSHLEHLVADQTTEVGATLRGVNEANRLLMVARQRREVVEKVRQRRKAVYEAELRRLEQKALDEMTGHASLAQGLLNLVPEGSVGLSS
jgi:flagellar export protein FliJ